MSAKRPAHFPSSAVKASSHRCRGLSGSAGLGVLTTSQSCRDCDPTPEAVVITFILLSGRRVYPSAAAMKVGPGHVGTSETIRAVRAEHDAIGLVATCCGPPAPGTAPMVATAEVGHDNVGGGTVFAKSATAGAFRVVGLVPGVTSMAMTPTDGFDTVLRLDRNAGVHCEQR